MQWVPSPSGLRRSRSRLRSLADAVGRRNWYARCSTLAVAAMCGCSNAYAASEPGIINSPEACRSKLSTDPLYYAAEALRHRKVAEECRLMAATTPHALLRDQYLTLAECYDRLADNEDKVANNLKSVSD